MPHVEAWSIRQIDAVIARLADALGHLDKVMPRWEEDTAPLRAKLEAAMSEAQRQRKYLDSQC